MKFKHDSKIAVLLGGLSKERDVSFRSGKAVANALRSKGYRNVMEIDALENVAETLARGKFDAAVITLHGKYGEDGTIQGILEYLKIPYTGTGVLGSALGMNKILSKKLFQMGGISTPPWFAADASWDAAKLRAEIDERLGLPAVVKPASEGSTIGLSVVRRPEEIADAHKRALEFDHEVIWEAYIDGKEVTVGFLKDRPLEVVEIVPKTGLFDYEAKYTKGMTEYFCPARIPEAAAAAVKKEAARAYAAVQSESFARVDLLLEGDRPWVLEVNTIPGMTETSLLPKAAMAEGISFEDMAETILQDARLKV